jgi:hypothetical protein
MGEVRDDAVKARMLRSHMVLMLLCNTVDGRGW